MRNGPLFEENQAFAPFVYPLLDAGIVATMLPPTPWSMRIWPMVALGCAANLLYQRTDIDANRIRVQFGFAFPLYVRNIPLSEIEAASSVTYSPIGEYGGWGIRGMGSRVALNARGNRGVLLTLKSGATILIGSQRPDELAAAIEELRK